MSYPFRHGETVTRIRGTNSGPPYNEIDWGKPDTEDYERCAVWQESSKEPIPDADGRASIVTVTKCVVPVDADILPTDRFRVRGQTYEVVGEIQRWHNPFTGWEPGAVVTGRWISG